MISESEYEVIRGHSYSTYARRMEGGRTKAYVMRTRGKGDIFKYVRKMEKSLFVCIL